jgi:hypothetical protein
VRPQKEAQRIYTLHISFCSFLLFLPSLLLSLCGLHTVRL